MPRAELCGLLLVGLAGLVAYRDTAAGMVAIWSRSDTFAHAWLVLPIVAWLIWRRREALTARRFEASAWWLLPMAGCAAAWLFGELSAVHALSQFAMTGLLVLAVPALIGTDAARTILFPLAFVFFCVPIGEFLLPYLIDGTADFTVWALRTTGIPVYREGTRFVIPSGYWSIVEACSGVRYLIASFMVGSLYAYLNYRSTRRRWTFAAISLALPIVANWVRAYLVVLLGHVSDNRLAAGIDHLVYGWLFFGVVVGLLFWIGMRWAEPGDAFGPGGGSARRFRSGPAGDARVRHDRALPVALAALGIVLFPPLLVRPAPLPASAALPVIVPSTPLGDGWQLDGSGGSAVAGWRPLLLGVESDSVATWQRGPEAVSVYLGYTRVQDGRHKLAGWANALVKSTDPHAWAAAAPTRKIVVPADPSRAGPVAPTPFRRHALLRAAQVDRPEARIVAWQTYWVDDRFVASDWEATLHGLGARLAGRDTGAAVIVLWAAEDADRPMADATLETFVRANLPAIAARLRATRDSSPSAEKASS